MERMKKGRRVELARLVMLGFSMMASAALWVATPGHAAAAGTEFDPEMEYRITVQTGNSAETLSPVKVGDVVEIGSHAFLVVYLSGYKAKGYVDLSSVRSILPAKQ